MSLTLDPVLATGLAGGSGSPIIRVEYLVGASSYITTSNVFSYEIVNMEAKAVIEPLATGTTVHKFRIIRGLLINGVEYLVTSSWFEITQNITTFHKTTFKGSAFTHKRISTAGDVTSDNLIGAVFTAAGNTFFTYHLSLPTDDSEWWRGIQFLPAGRVLLLQKTEALDAYLMQKYQAKICNLGQYSDQVNHVTVIGAHYRFEDAIYDHTIDGNRFSEISLGDPFHPGRYYTWVDEVPTRHYSGVSTDPLRNLGFIPSTASPAPLNYSGSGPSWVQLSMPNLAVTPGDNIQITNYTNFTTLMLVSVKEIFDPRQNPAWYQIISEIPYLTNTDGGALPSTIERVSNYTPLNTSGFNNNLDSSINNLQALAERTDELEIGNGIPDASATNDFLIGAQVSGVWKWVKNTLAQAKTVLGLGSQAYQNNDLAYFNPSTGRMVRASAAALDVQGIDCFAENGDRISTTSTISKTGLSLTASTLYHVYAYLNSGTPDIEVVTTAPATPYKGTARSKTGNTSRRYIGSVYATGTNTLAFWNHMPNVGLMMFTQDQSTSPWRVLSGGAATTETSVAFGSLAPAGATMTVKIKVTNGSGSLYLMLGNSEDGITLDSPANTAIYLVNLSTSPTIDFPIDASGNTTYMYHSAGGAAYIDFYGYFYER